MVKETGFGNAFAQRLRDFERRIVENREESGRFGFRRVVVADGRRRPSRDANAGAVDDVDRVELEIFGKGAKTRFVERFRLGA